MSKPSPSLAAIRKMNLPEVEARIERLKVEADRLRQKIERVKPTQSEKRIVELTDLLDRLTALQKAAHERLEDLRGQMPQGGYRGRNSRR